ncbi:MAG: hypothetical protein LBS68_02695 [Puniceicoccales bacterium]|jgi:hypothetical protein|nr:hypothetical protein [Puniceicoccales bacterium]
MRAPVAVDVAAIFLAIAAGTAFFYFRRRHRASAERAVASVASLLQPISEKFVKVRPLPRDGGWSLRGKFRRGSFLIYAMDRRWGGVGKNRCVIRQESPSLEAGGDLSFDMRPRSLVGFLGQMVSSPFIPFGNEILDRDLAFRCSDGIFAGRLLGFDEYRRALFDFWALGCRRGVIHFTGGTLTYLTKWPPKNTDAAEEFLRVLGLLCDLSDLIRSRSWAPLDGGSPAKKNSNSPGHDQESKG